jgi:hypothetical protein
VTPPEPSQAVLSWATAYCHLPVELFLPALGALGQEPGISSAAELAQSLVWSSAGKVLDAKDLPWARDCSRASCHLLLPMSPKTRAQKLLFLSAPAKKQADSNCFLKPT